MCKYAQNSEYQEVCIITQIIQILICEKPYPHYITLHTQSHAKSWPAQCNLLRTNDVNEKTVLIHNTIFAFALYCSI